MCATIARKMQVAEIWVGLVNPLSVNGGVDSAWKIHL